MINKSLLKFTSLPNHDDNQQLHKVHVVSGVTNIKKGRWLCQKTESYRQAECPPGGSIQRHAISNWHRSLQRCRAVKPYRQARSPPGCNLLRHTKKLTGKVYKEVDRQSLRSRPRFYWISLSKAQPEVDYIVDQVDQDSIEASFGNCNHEVDWMETEADFQWGLPS